MAGDKLEGDEGPLAVKCYVKGDHVILDFGKDVSWLALHPKDVRSVAQSLLAQAAALDNKPTTNAPNKEELEVYAQALFTGCGNYLSAQSAVGLSSVNEVLGMAVSLLANNAAQFVAHTQRHHPRRNGKQE